MVEEIRTPERSLQVESAGSTIQRLGASFRIVNDSYVVESHAFGPGHTPPVHIFVPRGELSRGRSRHPLDADFHPQKVDGVTELGIDRHIGGVASPVDRLFGAKGQTA